MKQRQMRSKTLVQGLTALFLCLSLGFGQFDDAYAGRKTLSKESPLRNWGLDNKEFNSHINARKAWKITQGKKNVVVAVIDTGIDASHPALKDNLWTKAGSDEYGFDFVLNKKNPVDTNSHGSHIAGIIAGSADNGAGAAGVAPKVSIMAIRYYSDGISGSDNLANSVKAIHYAIDNGAQVINYSGGGAEFSSAEYKAIQRAEAKGILVVAAAGNDASNLDSPGMKYYPGAYGLSNIISVASTNIRNQILTSSNYGMRTVHVAAPGEQIYSTLPRGRYGYMTGTSQATAFVSGLAALILSENPKLKPSEVRDIIMRSSDKLESLASKVVAGGRINAFAALKEALPENRKSLALQLEEDSAGKPVASVAALSAKQRQDKQTVDSFQQLVRKVAGDEMR